MELDCHAEPTYLHYQILRLMALAVSPAALLGPPALAAVRSYLWEVAPAPLRYGDTGRPREAAAYTCVLSNEIRSCTSPSTDFALPMAPYSGVRWWQEWGFPLGACSTRDWGAADPAPRGTAHTRPSVCPVVWDAKDLMERPNLFRQWSRGPSGLRGRAPPLSGRMFRGCELPTAKC